MVAFWIGGDTWWPFRIGGDTWWPFWISGDAWWPFRIGGDTWWPFFAGMTMSMTMAWQPLSGNDNEYDNGMAASLREWQWRPFFGYDNGGLSLDMITVAPLWITILQRWYGSAGHVWLDPHLLW